jgi:hypothetical protein
MLKVIASAHGSSAGVWEEGTSKEQNCFPVGVVNIGNRSSKDGQGGIVMLVR